MTEHPLGDERVHPESPAEGDPDADPSDDVRAHSQDPAEGPDVPDEPHPKS
ncbi:MULTISPECIES: hypothetical protein [unclassified Pseudarthrobacter]|jgi:hypothetical protein|uniref:hypothetical protein n=1 Tax=unclassified Pseudarthrobacter TaxID=2647000 RepID=UPI003636E0C1